jgi:sterol desaturase/sphingolipid hydroxylase (fatty acid hydroxylase superfamily)
MSEESVLGHELGTRVLVFVLVFTSMALWEVVAPRRPLSTRKLRRWLRNLGLVSLDVLAVRLIFPAGAVGLAWLARESGFGLLNAVELSAPLEFILSLLALDLTVYLQHVLFHGVPALWRLHMVHHADLDFDVTTGNRFHPIEILVSMAIKGTVIASLGPTVLSVLVFETLLNATAMFNHGNVRIPPGVDRVLRFLVVTPDMHRVHHSTVPFETNSNFGFNFPWWDRLLGTYRPEPRAGQEQMTVGLRQFRDPGRLTLPRLLVLPLFGDIGSYTLARPTRLVRSPREPALDATGKVQR